MLAACKHHVDANALRNTSNIYKLHAILCVKIYKYTTKMWNVDGAKKYTVNLICLPASIVVL